VSEIVDPEPAPASEPAPDPNAPERVFLAGGGSHDGLNVFLGHGLHLALRYPDGHLELLLSDPDAAPPAEAPAEPPAEAPADARAKRARAGSKASAA
jgi:hypothetical protein